MAAKYTGSRYKFVTVLVQMRLRYGRFHSETRAGSFIPGLFQGGHFLGK
jgi:hypothetical protein